MSENIGGIPNVTGGDRLGGTDRQSAMLRIGEKVSCSGNSQAERFVTYRRHERSRQGILHITIMSK